MAVQLSMLASQPSVADDLKVECPEPAFPNRCYVVNMKPGDEALIAGDLFSVEMAVTMAQRAQNVNERIRIAISKTSSTAKADKIRDDTIWSAKLKAKDSQIEYLEGAAERAWWESPMWLPVAFVVGVAAVIGIVAAVEHRPQPLDR